MIRVTFDVDKCTKHIYTLVNGDMLTHQKQQKS